MTVTFPGMRVMRGWLAEHGTVKVIALVGAIASLTWTAVTADSGRLTPLFIVLALGAVGANLVDARTESQSLFISGAVLAGLLALAFFGPAWAFAIGAVAELAGWLFERYRVASFLINLVGAAVAVIAAGALFDAFSARQGSFGFYLALTLAAVLLLATNIMVVGGLHSALDGFSFVEFAGSFARSLAPSFAITVALTLAAAAVCIKLGVAGGAFVAITLVAFSYMANLVATARHRSKQYASLSWGVLSGLLRTLDIRDPRAARHAAAVAAFARDIARAAGMSEQECELVHTAGLLHDIGHFALSDRVAERGRILSEEDWAAIRRHPELGADLLRDLGLYGPVAEIVRAHHERIDGRGYPDGIGGGEIPELAKILSVAEVYDTLTAHDTYRTPVSSFEALTELRRVSGTQLEGRYVEILAHLLSGSDLTYRHADAADFGRELDLERRLNEAAAN